MKTRPRDHLWDAWVAQWGEPVTADERGRINRALKELREVATPEDVTRALKTYLECTLPQYRSPQSVTANWSQLATKPKPRVQSTACHHGVSFFERCPKCVEEA